jgi:hypothetical protein
LVKRGSEITCVGGGQSPVMKKTGLCLVQLNDNTCDPCFHYRLDSGMKKEGLNKGMIFNEQGEPDGLNRQCRVT